MSAANPYVCCTLYGAALLCSRIIPNDRRSCLCQLIALCSQHSMSQQMFTFSVGSQSISTMLLTAAAQNTDATAFQHTDTLYIMWLSMKMDVSTALKLILSKMVNPCLTMSPWIQGPICSSFNDWRSARAPPNISFCELPSHIFLPTMHSHTAVSQLYMDNAGYSFHKPLQCNG